MIMDRKNNEDSNQKIDLFNNNMRTLTIKYNGGTSIKSTHRVGFDNGGI